MRKTYHKHKDSEEQFQKSPEIKIAVRSTFPASYDLRLFIFYEALFQL